MKVKIVITYDNKIQAEYDADAIRQIVMCRNPNDEPSIEIKEEK